MENIKIRYIFELNNSEYMKIFHIEAIENGWAEAEFKLWSQVKERDLFIGSFDKNNNEIYVNDIIREIDWFWDKNYYHVRYKKWDFYLEQIKWLNFNWSFVYWTNWSFSKLVSEYDKKWNVILKSVDVLWNNHNLNNLKLN